MKTADRLEQILAVLLIQTMKDSPQKDQIRQLRRAGFTNVEIADLLDTTTGVVAQTIYEAGKKKAAKK